MHLTHAYSMYGNGFRGNGIFQNAVPGQPDMSGPLELSCRTLKPISQSRQSKNLIFAVKIRGRYCSMVLFRPICTAYRLPNLSNPDHDGERESTSTISPRLNLWPVGFHEATVCFLSCSCGFRVKSMWASM